MKAKQKSARVTLSAVNAELARRGIQARLARAGGYFYFQFGEAADWIDRTVDVPKISELSLDEWVAKFNELKRRNEEIRRAGAKRKNPIAAKAAVRVKNRDHHEEER